MPPTTDDLGQLVLELGVRVHLGRGETLFSEGDPSSSVYACRTGRLKVTVSTPTGDELLLGWKGPGDAFGELSAIDGRPRSARVVAAEPSELAALSRADFLDGLRHAPQVAVGLLVELSDHLRRANASLTARRSDRVPVRVAQRLVELAALVLRHRGTSAPIELELTQDDLAAWIGATRESTARALAELRRGRLIETGRGRIVVLDVPALERQLATASR